MLILIRDVTGNLILLFIKLLVFTLWISINFLVDSILFSFFLFLKTFLCGSMGTMESNKRLTSLLFHYLCRWLLDLQISYYWMLLGILERNKHGQLKFQASAKNSGRNILLVITWLLFKKRSENYLFGNHSKIKHKSCEEGQRQRRWKWEPQGKLRAEQQEGSELSGSVQEIPEVSLYECCVCVCFITKE